MNKHHRLIVLLSRLALVGVLILLVLWLSIALPQMLFAPQTAWASNVSDEAREVQAQPFRPLGSSLLFESFDGVVFPPANWGTTILTGTTQGWSQVTLGNSPFTFPHSGAGMAQFSSFSIFPGDSTRLYTPILNLTGQMTPTLTFWMNHDTGFSSSNDRIHVQISTDGGINYTAVLTTVSRHDGSTGWKQHTVDLSTYIGQSNVRLGFVAISDFGNNMFIDDVKVEPPPPPPTPVLALSESFEGATFPPTDWGTTSVTGGVQGWSRVTSGSNPTSLPHSGVGMAQFNSFSLSTGNSTRLYTPLLDLSGQTKPTLKFWMYHDTGYTFNNDRIQVQISTDGGTNYTAVLTTVSRYDGSTGWKQHTVDLLAYGGQSAVRLGFLAISAFGDNMFIDDVAVEPVTVLPTSLVFANQMVGTTSPPQMVAVQNGGNVGLTISSIALSSDYTQNTTCPLSPATLAAGSSCQINVSFSPVATRTRPGVLTVTHNALGGVHTINLMGRGIVSFDPPDRWTGVISDDFQSFSTIAFDVSRSNGIWGNLLVRRCSSLTCDLFEGCQCHQYRVTTVNGFGDINDNAQFGYGSIFSGQFISMNEATGSFADVFGSYPWTAHLNQPPRATYLPLVIKSQ